MAVVILFYLMAVVILCVLIRYDYQRQGFSFQLIFSVIYFVTFLAGEPFSWLLSHYFAQPLMPISQLYWTLFAILGGYLIYFICYQFSWRKQVGSENISLPVVTNFVPNLTACLLLLLSSISLIGFIWLNQGFLLFKLTKYSQIFSAQVQAIPLKRFFYFFLPALLIWFFIKPTRQRWILFIVIGAILGTLNYLAIGGTRANLALAVGLFLLLGIYQGYLTIRGLLISAILIMVGMFILALVRYNLSVTGTEAWFTFLYLTRDTFSPWQNLTTILSNEIEYQGLMPIIRDFYVYIPQSVWAERPDIVWNCANYFTKVVLNNHSGLAISPTLLGSFYIMGGGQFIILGMGIVGLLVKSIDSLFNYGRKHSQQNVSVLIQAFCFANLFNLIVLVREGFDAFVSRWVFFSIIFGLCWLLAYGIQYRQNHSTTS